MNRNIEIKARVNNIATLALKVAILANNGPTQIQQDDIFFECKQGRFKLRKFSEKKGELIYYKRNSQSEPKESNYSVVPTSKPNELQSVLTAAYGQVGRVVKNRTLFIVGRTRIHLDRVKGLGDFLEIEVILKPNESLDSGVREAYELIEELNIKGDQLVADAYIDLIYRLKSKDNL